MGSLIAGVGLDLIRFPANIAELGPNPQLDPGTVAGLGVMVGPGAAAMAVLCAITLRRYSLNGARVAQIQQDLAARRA